MSLSLVNAYVILDTCYLTFVWFVCLFVSVVCCLLSAVCCLLSVVCCLLSVDKKLQVQVYSKFLLYLNNICIVSWK